MAISRTSVLTGHVVVSTARTLVSSVLVVGVALLMGFRPDGDLVRWLAAFGLLALLALALTWLAVAVGLAAKTAEGTTPFLFIVQLLPFLSSAFVPPDSMSAAVRWFADNEPFTPIIDALRGLLLGTPVDDSGALAVGWCVGLALAGYVWARLLFRRDPVPERSAASAAARRPSWSRPAYVDTASAYAGRSACRAMAADALG